MLSVQCPKCGGTNIFDETKQIPTYCAFCSAHLPDMTKFVEESIKLNLEKERHKIEMESMKEKRKDDIGKYIGIGFTMLLILALIIFGIVSITNITSIIKH